MGPFRLAEVGAIRLASRPTDAARAVIEQTVFTRASDLFGLDWTVTLNDLTNTFFEGAARGNPKAQRRHSKEQRNDCPLITLGLVLVLDGSGFVRRPQTFDGAVTEGTTL